MSLKAQGMHEIFFILYSVMIDVIATITLTTAKRPKKFQAFNGIKTHDLCITGAMLSQQARLCDCKNILINVMIDQKAAITLLEKDLKKLSNLNDFPVTSVMAAFAQICLSRGDIEHLMIPMS